MHGDWKRSTVLRNKNHIRKEFKCINDIINNYSANKEIKAKKNKKKLAGYYNKQWGKKNAVINNKKLRFI